MSNLSVNEFMAALPELDDHRTLVEAAAAAVQGPALRSDRCRRAPLSGLGGRRRQPARAAGRHRQPGRSSTAVVSTSAAGGARTGARTGRRATADPACSPKWSSWRPACNVKSPEFQPELEQLGEVIHGKIKVGVLGATGAVGQRFVPDVTGTPWFEITALCASSAARTSAMSTPAAGTCAATCPNPMRDGAARMQAVDCQIVFNAALGDGGRIEATLPRPATSCAATRAITATTTTCRC